MSRSWEGWEKQRKRGDGWVGEYSRVGGGLAHMWLKWESEGKSGGEIGCRGHVGRDHMGPGRLLVFMLSEMVFLEDLE